MLPAMSRWAVLVILAACGSHDDKQDKPKAVTGPEKIAVPTDDKAPPPQTNDNPQFHLKPEEGSLTTKCEAKPGALTASFEVQPASGYHISQDYPIKLTIEPPAGVKVDKTVTPQSTDNPQFHLKPEEGSLTTKCEAKPGALTASLELQPAAGYHISQDYPIKLTIEAPAGVKVDKTELTAGGRDKSQGDAQQLSEQHLAFAVKATPDKPGNYEIKGIFKFGVCDKDSCHPKKQPVAIQCAAI